jgi:hypothetical protein
MGITLGMSHPGQCEPGHVPTLDTGPDPVTGKPVYLSLSVKSMVEFGSNHASFKPIQDFALEHLDSVGNDALNARLGASIEHLDVTSFQKEKLNELGLVTIGEVLASDESVFKKAYYVGKIRATDAQCCGCGCSRVLVGLTALSSERPGLTPAQRPNNRSPLA